MVTVSSSEYRVFSVDPPHLPLAPYPGKMVPTGILEDTCTRGGVPYGRLLATQREHILYIAAKYGEECPEYLRAPPSKRASEMADIKTLAEYARSKLGHTAGTGHGLRSKLLLPEIITRWHDLVKKADLLPDEELHRQCLRLMAHTGGVMYEELRDGVVELNDVLYKQQAKEARFGRFEGWIITHQALRRADTEMITLLLKAGWHECRADAAGLFPALRKASAVTRDQIQAVTPR